MRIDLTEGRVFATNLSYETACKLLNQANNTLMTKVYFFLINMTSPNTWALIGCPVNLASIMRQSSDEGNTLILED